MQSAKQKVSDAASAAKHHLDIIAAKSEEKVERAAARTEEGKQIAEEKRKAKEAEAKMNLHEAKAHHAADKQQAKEAHLYKHNANTMVGGHQVGHYHEPVVGGVVDGVAPSTGPAIPGYPLGGYPHGHTRNI